MHPFSFRLFIVDHHVCRVVNVIVHSHSWLHQANGRLKGITILCAQDMAVHEQDYYYFWVHYPVLGHCRVAELISSIAALMNFCSSGLSKISSTGTSWHSFLSEASITMKLWHWKSHWKSSVTLKNLLTKEMGNAENFQCDLKYFSVMCDIYFWRNIKNYAP